MSTLEKTYFPFVIANIVIFSIAVIPIIGVVYLTWFLFVPAIGFSICNYIVARDNRFNTNPWDLVILILSVVTLIPIIGWLTGASALAFSIITLVKYNKYKAKKSRSHRDS
ncbi:hypothetical protein PN441_01135 [Spirulina major CS-329]|uniref:hypothetical protein n=1 Tax=Spirulina TaxID=1154 RepID=UPI00232DDBEB|nr:MULTISPECIES: hypothetical protein [Spirulina]MDB9497054.1 hypothetical protein [Spirulina subsalsa CS-330]MDB9501658.1 hypothetical protein [Spirulina major CS-329]